jgi:hypothetical protein
MSPPLGYPREFLTLEDHPAGPGAANTATLGTGLVPDDLLFMVPGPTSIWNESLALLCFILDKGRLDVNTIPAAQESIGHHKSNDKLVGDVSRFRLQATGLLVWASCDAMQGTFVPIHANKRLHEEAYIHAKRDFVGMRRELELWDEARQQHLTQPQHTIFATLSAALGRDIMSETYDGDRKLLLRFGPRPSMIDKKTLGHHLVMHLKRRHAIREQGEATWGQWNEQPVKGSETQSTTPRLLDFIELSEMLNSYPPSAQWGDIKTKLGWHAVTMSMSNVRQNAANFIVTDGEDYTGPPGNSLLGMTPCVHLGNLKAFGLARRDEPDFNTKPLMVPKNGETNERDPNKGTLNAKMRLWVLVGHGHAPTYDGGERFEQKFMLLSQSMGEDKVTALNIDQASEDPNAASIVEHYRAKPVPGYLKPYWERLATFPESGSAYQTDWDPWVDGLDAPLASERDAGAAWGRAMNGQIVPSSSSDLIFARKEGGAFLHRIVVRDSWEQGANDKYDGLDNLGRCYVRWDQDGRLEYSGGVKMTTTSADIDALPATAPITAASFRNIKVPEVGGKADADG